MNAKTLDPEALERLRERASMQTSGGVTLVRSHDLRALLDAYDTACAELRKLVAGLVSLNVATTVPGTSGDMCDLGWCPAEERNTLRARVAELEVEREQLRDRIAVGRDTNEDLARKEQARAEKAARRVAELEAEVASLRLDLRTHGAAHIETGRLLREAVEALQAADKLLRVFKTLSFKFERAADWRLFNDVEALVSTVLAKHPVKP